MFKIYLFSLIFGIGALSLVGCSTSIDDYSAQSDTFELDTFFDGHLKAWGVFENYEGKVIRRFTVNMTGTWEGNQGVLDEDFIYDDGETQKRIWYLTKTAQGQYEGTASDVIGIAKGQAKGFALNWQYTMRLQTDDTEYDVQFDDWMYLVDTNSVINKASVKKWGVDVGQVTLFIEKQ